MEWYWVLAIIFGALLVLMASGLPVAFCFILISVVGAALLWGPSGQRQVLDSMWRTLASFTYLPVVMFVLLGEVVFHSGMAMRAIDVVDKWVGRVPGRLALLVVAVSTLFATMSGSAIATSAMLGDVLLPEMKKRGYANSIAIGSIAGSGGLAIMIPPSSAAVILGSIGGISVGKLLIAGILPGIIMAIFYGSYIIGRCWLQPDIAPPYEITRVSLSRKLNDTFKYVAPFALIIFAVTGLIFLGIATPSEAAATGALASIILALIYRQMGKKLLFSAILRSVKIAAMILMIVAGAGVFSQVIAYTGASREMARWVLGLPLPPVGVLIAMMVILLVMGCFMTGVAMMMIALPIFMPIVQALHLDPVWFGLLFLLNVEIGQETPPFGVLIFTMQGVAKDIPTGEIIKALIPFTLLDVSVLGLIVAFPALATWLPSIMARMR